MTTTNITTKAEEKKTEPKNGIVPLTTTPASAPLATIGTKALTTVNIPADKVKVTAGPSVGEVQLDRAVAEVQKLKSAASACGWDLGRKIAEIFDKQLHKNRPDENGDPKYKHWNSFCQVELAMSPANAYMLMDISKAFTREHVLTYGTTKCGIAIKAPPEDQTKLLEMAGRRSKREMAVEVQKAREKAGLTKRDTGRKEVKSAGQVNKGGRAKAVKAAGGDKITVASLLQAYTIPLFQKPEKRGAVLTEGPRAKKLGDKPMGVLDLPNGVRLWLLVTASAAGELQIKAHFKRDE